ncbi:hypothetical protein [Vulgatibacter incomptus]|uniref:hypothetical protein n=1 Tax=Vulgatibacter incomptus TaxID=1391653 RepID=UPI0012F98F48|nr:hypothetical protein [Vulgatibacter incomptus]
MHSYLRNAMMAGILILAGTPGFKAFAAPPLPTLPITNELSQECTLKTGYSAVAVGQSWNGDFHVGSYCGFTKIWSTSTGVSRLLDLHEGTQIRAAGPFMATDCEENARRPWVTNLDRMDSDPDVLPDWDGDAYDANPVNYANLHADVPFAILSDMFAVDAYKAQVFWTAPQTPDPFLSWYPYSNPSPHQPRSKALERIGITSFGEGTSAESPTITAAITPAGDDIMIEGFTIPDGIFNQPTPQKAKIPGPASQLDVFGDTVVYVKSGAIYWETLWRATDGKIDKSTLGVRLLVENLGCSSFHHPILGGSSTNGYRSAPSYVIFEGRKCDKHPGSVLFLADIRDPKPQNQPIYVVDDVMESPTNFQASFDTENYSIAYIKSNGSEVNFVEFSLP